ncbi:MAG: hypothetical protein QXT58_04125, partial [Archaeoglobaceae archaeon]
FTHSLGLFYLLVGVATVGGSIGLPSLTSLISQSASAAEQGRIQGVSGSLESLARIVAPIWGNGALKYSDALPYASAAGLLFVAAGIAMGLRPAVQKPLCHSEWSEESRPLKTDR